MLRAQARGLAGRGVAGVPQAPCPFWGWNTFNMVFTGESGCGAGPRSVFSLMTEASLLLTRALTHTL